MNDNKEMYLERLELVSERISQIANNQDECIMEYQEFFSKTASFLVETKKIYDIHSSINKLQEEELMAIQARLYDEIQDIEAYQTSYANPDYAVKQLPIESVAKILCALYGDLRGCIAYAYEGNVLELTIFFELFVQIYGIFTMDDIQREEEVKEVIQDFYEDYVSDILEIRTRKMLSPEENFATKIVMESNLLESRYLYFYGEYISETEIEMAKFFSKFLEEEIEEFAKPYTKGFYDGFAINNVSFEGKNTVNIRYTIGFERIVRAAVKQFEEMGLKPLLYRSAVCSIYRRNLAKVGYHSIGKNRQYDYDHRFDDAMYLTKSYVEKKLQAQKYAYEQNKEYLTGYAGPALIETFGEEDFSPIVKETALHYTNKQKNLFLSLQNRMNVLSDQYIPGDSVSFTIIAYPVVDIGKDFEEIFKQTAKLNTLDVDVYRQIQQKLIDTLDTGAFVRVEGGNGNKTSLDIALRKLEKPAEETQFENCLADVNIPLGEVFTSPVLEGTNGILHVKHVYLNDLEYHDLELQFTDGMISQYTCKNYTDEQKNKDFVKENILYNHSSLPMGEFAIGTNTIAYQMARTFQIERKLPILIAEKTGPHFAVGDTCYHQAEDIETRNPDGKRIVSKENSVSALRKTEPEKAYFGCHTDVTIPYDELQRVAVYYEDGTFVDILKDGMFVLEGTEELNKGFSV